jgi:hypothetical protein
MSRLRLHNSGADDAPDASDLPPAQDPVTRELRALYAAPAERYWDDLEGRIVAAVMAGAARPARTAAHWWQTMADWARPGLAAAAVLVIVVGAVTLQSRATRTNVAGGPAGAPALELQPVDPELARAVDDALRADSAEVRAAQEAAYLLTGGVKRRAPVQLDVPAAPAAPPRTGAPARDARSPDDDDVQRARREATFRYVMPD